MVDTALYGVETSQPRWMIADWLGFVKPVISGKDRVVSPDQILLY